MRSTGPIHAWRSFRRDRALESLAAARRRSLTRELWEGAARELGATLTELAPNRCEIRRGSAATILTGQTTLLNSGHARALADSKPSAYKLLAEAGLPIPEHRAFDASDTSVARAFLECGPTPCILKPASGNGGDGVTGNIHCAAELRRAVVAASAFGPHLLIERQLVGDVVRFLVLDGEVIDAVQRLRPYITGDGSSTVEDLMIDEYERRIRGEGNTSLKPFAVDLDCLLTLKHSGVGLRDVLPSGAVLEVKAVTNYNRPEDNRTLEHISADFRAEASAAAAALGLRLAGVDVVAPTLTTSLSAGGGGVIDVNATPALHHHTLVANPGAAPPVTVLILRALLESANG
jgi:cyanophycin synthetase